MSHIIDSTDDDVEVVASFPLGRRFMACAVISTWNGKAGLNIRRYLVATDGTLKPTAKGLRIPIEHAPDFIKKLAARFGV